MTFLVFGLVIFCIAQPGEDTISSLEYGSGFIWLQNIFNSNYFLNDKTEIYRFMFDTKKFIDSVWLLVLTQIGNQLEKIWTVCDTLY